MLPEITFNDNIPFMGSHSISSDFPLVLGHNINTSHGFVTVAEYARKTGADVCQIFLRTPHKFQVSRRNRKDIKKLSEELKKHNVKVLIHGSFLINFCQPVTSYIHKQGMRILIEDLEDSVLLGAMGVVIHMGHNTCKLSDEAALNNYVKGIKNVLRNSNPNSVLILETGAGQGHEIGTDIIDLGNIRKMLSIKERQRVKFCLDTCHMFSAGYNLGCPNYVDMLEGHINLNLGWSNVVAIHLNDSVEHLNCHKDRHADIGYGKINIKGIKRFVEICVKHKVPMILETPADTNIVINVDKEMRIKKRYTHEEQMKEIRSWFS